PGVATRRTAAMERSQVGPYLSAMVSVLPTVASSTSHPEMKPSAWRISAMFDFSLEYGMDTTSWYAELALRTRVSMSAIGSVIVMGSACPLSSRFHLGHEATFDVGVMWKLLGSLLTSCTWTRREAHRGEPCPGGTHGTDRTCGRPSAADHSAGTACSPGP